MAEDEGFVGRWSRLKGEARGNRKAEPPATRSSGEDDAAALPPRMEEPVAPAREAAPPEPKMEGEVAAVDPASLPDVETLTYQSDYGAFLQKGVPTELRNQALRQLWRSNPVLANLDGLVEYGEDFTGVGTRKMAVRTAYRVGRGMIDWALEEPEGEREAAERAGKDAARPVPASVEPARAVKSEPARPEAKRGKRRTTRS